MGRLCSQYFIIQATSQVVGTNEMSLAAIRSQFDVRMPKRLDKLAICRKYESIKDITSANDCISDMIKYVDVMIDNVGMYYQKYDRIYRTRSSGIHLYAIHDIDNIDQAVISCIRTIAKHNK